MKQSLSNVGKNQSEVMEKLSSISKEVSNHNDIFLDMSRLIAVFEEAQDSINHAAIIRALKPLSAHTRESEINRHHRKTFEWIIEPECESQGQPDLHSISFVDWLKHGSGVFHFAGKPGSGKSTLFKLLANDYRVHQALEE
jgi:ABC-type bacteriocin/lantibiotic exporter with double-glycine peptidase domain